MVNELTWAHQERDNIEYVKNNKKDFKHGQIFIEFFENSTAVIESKRNELVKVAVSSIKLFNDENFRRKRRIRQLLKLYGDGSKKLQSEIEKKRKDYDDVRASFIDHMKLEAPAKYWQNRSKSANAARIIYLVAFLIALVSTICVFKFSIIPWLEPNVHAVVSKDKYPIFEVSAFVSLSAFSFWIIRLIARLALSSHHLKIDADERNIMMQTYLALIQGGGASENEREIILQTLFKPTSDGIVKEDPQIELPFLNAVRGK